MLHYFNLNEKELTDELCRLQQERDLWESKNQFDCVVQYKLNRIKENIESIFWVIEKKIRRSS